MVLSHLLADTDIIHNHQLTRHKHQAQQLLPSQKEGVAAALITGRDSRGQRATPRCLELGAGTGAVSLSLVAARYSTHSRIDTHTYMYLYTHSTQVECTAGSSRELTEYSELQCSA